VVQASAGGAYSSWQDEQQAAYSTACGVGHHQRHTTPTQRAVLVSSTCRLNVCLIAARALPIPGCVAGAVSHTPSPWPPAALELLLAVPHSTSARTPTSCTPDYTLNYVMRVCPCVWLGPWLPWCTGRTLLLLVLGSTDAGPAYTIETNPEVLTRAICLLTAPLNPAAFEN